MRIEAWAPDAGACYEEAVAAFVELFADTSDAPPGEPVHFEVGPGAGDELLVLLLEQVLFGMDVHHWLPRATHVEQCESERLAGTFSDVPVEKVVLVGSIPKGVAYHDLFFGAGEGGWRCRATIDV